jgi:hypothetical protein
MMVSHFLWLTKPSALVLFLLTILLAVGSYKPARADSHQQIDCGEHLPFRIGSGLLEAWPNTDWCNYVYQSTNGFEYGGVNRDGIVPLYPEGYIYPNGIPRYGGWPAAFEVTYESIPSVDVWLADQSPVIALEINGDARAYPLGILIQHEIANTRVGGTPVAVTFCPLCNSGIVFVRRLNDQELHFGVTGFLRFSDLIMWDHETESWWQQSTGEGLVGDFAGEYLTFVTSSMVSYGQFKDEFPDGHVLSAQGRDYNYNPYVGYDSATTLSGIQSTVEDETVSPLDRILGYRHITMNGDSIFVAYPFKTLQEIVIANDVVGGQPRVVFWQPGAVSALDRVNIDGSREVGAANLFDPTLEDGTLLSFSANGTIIHDEQTGSTWNIFGKATQGELKGTQLRQIMAFPHFWFTWQSFHSFSVIWAPGTTTDIVLAARNQVSQ